MTVLSQGALSDDSGCCELVAVFACVYNKGRVPRKHTSMCCTVCTSAAPCMTHPTSSWCVLFVEYLCIPSPPPRFPTNALGSDHFVFGPYFWAPELIRYRVSGNLIKARGFKK